MRQSKKNYTLIVLTVLAVIAIGISYNKKAVAKPKALSLDPHKVPLIIPDNVIKRGHTVTMPILMYHHVGEFPTNANSIRKDLTVPTLDFDAEAAWLSKHGYQSISLEDLYLYSQGKFTLPKKPIIFTFDDGYQDVFENAVPILKKYNFMGSFAIITQWPGQTQGDNVYASWDDIKTAKAQGMEIVCHTQNHFDGTNPKFSISYIFKNLSGCKKDLQDNRISNDIFIYPYGHYSTSYIAQAQKAGFRMGVTVHHGDVINLEDLMQVPRIRVHGTETIERFEDIILHKIKPKSSTTTTESLK